MKCSFNTCVSVLYFILQLDVPFFCIMIVFCFSFLLIFSPSFYLCFILISFYLLIWRLCMYAFLLHFICKNCTYTKIELLHRVLCACVYLHIYCFVTVVFSFSLHLFFTSFSLSIFMLEASTCLGSEQNRTAKETQSININRLQSIR